MISSMTGFGSGRVEVPNVVISVEAKTVNHRYLDLHVRLPIEFQSFEPVVREAVSGRLCRGRVDILVKIEMRRKEIQMEADPSLIASYVELVRGLQRRFPITGDITLEAISRLPGAITVSGGDLGTEERNRVAEHLAEAVTIAVDEVRAMRQKEGEALAGDLHQRARTIRRNLDDIRQAATVLLQHYRGLLTSRVKELAPDLEVDSYRLETEALLHAEKSDIAEEITRLDSHLKRFDETISQSGEAGKRLDFLLQEMNREITTVLSKTSGLNQSGVGIGEAAMEIKVEIDKLREQVQNIE